MADDMRIAFEAIARKLAGMHDGDILREGGNRSRGSVGNAHLVTGPATPGAAWGQAGAGRSWGTARPAMRAVHTPTR